MKSLDPRVRRLNIAEEGDTHLQQTPDQLITFEVFLQKKENMPYDHVGIVHAPTEEMAFVFAKEQFSRRFTCSGLMIANTQHVMVTPYSELEESVYDQIAPAATMERQGNVEQFEIFHLTKRGKQHRHMGSVEATDYEDALVKAKEAYTDDKPVLNIWLIKQEHILFSKEEDKDIWNTLSEKKHRDVTSYRAKEKIDSLKGKQV